MTTGIFCRPSCKSKLPKRENVIFINFLSEAEKYKLRPCKRCRPDLVNYNPNRELVVKIKKIYTEFYNKPDKIKSIINDVGVSSNTLMRSFKQFENMTQKQYLTKIRIEKSKEYLIAENISVLEIALNCGFESLSNFYKSFKLLTGLTPSDFRNQNKEGREK